mmetsp:Transcript_16433/g.29771  ORF Transcript_16433/g.29771 Transcript_16433/m.29771 type:complete len:89 (+) Transcript_16433:60-326(+)
MRLLDMLSMLVIVLGMQMETAMATVPRYQRSNLRGTKADQVEQDAYLNSIRNKKYNTGSRPLYGVQLDQQIRHGPHRVRGMNRSYQPN